VKEMEKSHKEQKRRREKGEEKREEQKRREREKGRKRGIKRENGRDPEQKREGRKGFEGDQNIWSMWRKKSTLRSRIHNCSIPRSLARSPLTLSLRSRALALHLSMWSGKMLTFKHKNKVAVSPTLYSIAKPNFES
jgi:hypothetical protein